MTHDSIAAIQPHGSVNSSSHKAQLQKWHSELSQQLKELGEAKLDTKTKQLKQQFLQTEMGAIQAQITTLEAPHPQEQSASKANSPSHSDHEKLPSDSLVGSQVNVFT
jgi:hypothetical protein